MKTSDRTASVFGSSGHHAPEEKHLRDYVRVLYKRRWIILPLFLVVVVVGSVNTLRETPRYRGRVQLLIESDTPKVAKIDQMFESTGGYYDDEFRQTQYRILQSRTLAKRTIDAMQLWDRPRLGNGPEPKASLSVVALVMRGVSGAVGAAKSLVAGQ